MASTGHISWQRPQNIHLDQSKSYLVVLREPSGLGSDSMAIALAGHMFSHSLHEMHLINCVPFLAGGIPSERVLSSELGADHGLFKREVDVGLVSGNTSGSKPA